MEEKKSSGLAIAGLILGISSILIDVLSFFIPTIAWFCFVALATSILALVFGAVKRQQGMGVAALVLGIVGILLSILVVVFYIFAILLVINIFKH